MEGLWHEHLRLFGWGHMSCLSYDLLCENCGTGRIVIKYATLVVTLSIRMPFGKPSRVSPPVPLSVHGEPLRDTGVPSFWNFVRLWPVCIQGVVQLRLTCKPYKNMNTMYQQLEAFGYQAIDRGLIPDGILRRLIRFSCSLRIKELDSPSLEELHRRKLSFIDSLRSLPVAVHQSMQLLFFCDWASAYSCLTNVFIFCERKFKRITLWGIHSCPLST
jgi:hypothetical protein